MNTRMHEMERKSVSVWTPWGEQKLDSDQISRSKFRQRLELRRERRERRLSKTELNANRT